MVYTHGRLRSATPHQDGGFVLDLGLHNNWTEQPAGVYDVVLQITGTFTWGDLTAIQDATAHYIRVTECADGSIVIRSAEDGRRVLAELDGVVRSRTQQRVGHWSGVKLAVIPDE